MMADTGSRCNSCHALRPLLAWETLTSGRESSAISSVSADVSESSTIHTVRTISSSRIPLQRRWDDLLTLCKLDGNPKIAQKMNVFQTRPIRAFKE